MSGAPLASLVIVLLLVSTAHANPQRQPVDATLRELVKTAIATTDSFVDRYDAEVWLVDMSTRLARFVADDQKRVELLRHIHYEASRANLPPELVLAVIEVESRFDRHAISKAGAMGLMQIMPFWLKEIGRPNENLFDTRTNLRMGCTILRYYLDLEKDNITHALARYNGSINSYQYTNLVYRALDKRWRRR
ncbi:MAG: transglycosylase SLT domain-containing protein [Gammaproteobacteria bacterium]|nr:transglycosylase SLT domain-containing protein [Gammaproteobacteria bacterium]